jgi:hypothetical protein
VKGKIYFAAAYCRRLELLPHRYAAQCAGFAVVSRWLDGTRQVPGDDGASPLRGKPGDAELAKMRARFAHEDLEEVISADLLIAFTEPAGSGRPRGGRHVELGMAIGLERMVWIVGHRENIFCWLPGVRFFSGWPAVLRVLEEWP